MLEEPLPATHRALQKAGMTIGDIDLLRGQRGLRLRCRSAWLKDTGADPARLNVNGGAIALGHPLGALGHQADDDAGARAAGARQALRPADHVRGRRHGQRHDRRAALRPGARVGVHVGASNAGRARRPATVTRLPPLSLQRRHDPPFLHARIDAGQARLYHGRLRRDGDLPRARPPLQPGRAAVPLARPQGRRPCRLPAGEFARLHGDLLGRPALGLHYTAISRT